MNTIYKRMDTLRACITDKEIYMYIPGDKPKVADISKNKSHYDILMKCEDISKADFEKDINCNTVDGALFFVMYVLGTKQSQRDLNEPLKHKYNELPG